MPSDSGGVDPPAPYPGRRALIEKRKRDGSVAARWEASVVDRPPGPWCWFTARDTVRAHPRSDRHEVVGSHERTLAGNDWWVLTAHIGDTGAIDWMKVDAAASVAAGPDGCVWFCDLDIDLIIGPAGIQLRDEGDFARNAITMGYPTGMRLRADQALADVTVRHATRHWPFDGSLNRMAAAITGTSGRSGGSA